ncbi:7937_t:CDS:2 [Dentiscutata erythropus]|uniref:7937_t:CDS:1 n=1 Tax=Dentiscutata erythropus TaxID=1348616 RepID=A0A9N9CHE0_9GLOM|nr:7937_t:CDS:2 [Dentiscutata erythropus]
MNYINDELVVKNHTDFILPTTNKCLLRVPKILETVIKFKNRKVSSGTFEDLPEASPNSKVLQSTFRTNIISPEALPIQRSARTNIIPPEALTNDKVLQTNIIPPEALTNSRVLRSSSQTNLTRADVN